MTPAFAVRVYGLPVAQPRAGRRAFKLPTGQIKVQSYDPPPAKDWKASIRDQILPVKPETPLAGALALALRFELPRPTSLPKRVVHHVKKPDIDNLVKAVKDAIRGVVYLDDRQVVRLEATKGYGQSPGVEITVEAVG